jgi:hypothetical protein
MSTSSGFGEAENDEAAARSPVGAELPPVNPPGRLPAFKRGLPGIALAARMARKSTARIHAVGRSAHALRFTRDVFRQKRHNPSLIGRLLGEKPVPDQGPRRFSRRSVPDERSRPFALTAGRPFRAEPARPVLDPNKFVSHCL